MHLSDLSLQLRSILEFNDTTIMRSIIGGGGSMLRQEAFSFFTHTTSSFYHFQAKHSPSLLLLRSRILLAGTSNTPFINCIILPHMYISPLCSNLIGPNYTPPFYHTFSLVYLYKPSPFSSFSSLHFYQLCVSYISFLSSV